MSDDDTPDDDFEAEAPEDVFTDEPEDLDDEVEVFDDFDDEAEVVVEDDDVADVVVPAAAVPAAKATATKARKASDDEDDEEEDDDLDPDDVEADLDAILKDRIAAQPEDEDDEDEAPEPDDRSDGAGRIQPKKADEFVCQSCFLVKHRRQLADETLMLCVDCV
jgi:hypothetical protein